MSRRTSLLIAAFFAGLLTVLAMWLLKGGKTHPRTAEADDRSARSSEQLQSSTPAPIASSIHDRKTRDQIRQRIYQARGEAPPEPSGARRRAGTTVERTNASSAATSGGGQRNESGLDASYIREVVRSDFYPMAKQCYESALAENPKLAGKLVVFFTIVGDEKIGGIVESAEITDGTTIEDAKLQQCFAESMMTLAFKPPAHGGKVTVKYPIMLSNDDGPPDGG